MLFNLLSILSAYLLAFANALPSEGQQLEKRTFSGSDSDVVSHINDLTNSCNTLSSLIKEHYSSGSSQTSHLIDAASDCKSKAEAFTSKCTGYTIPDEPIDGFVSGCAGLVSACFNLCFTLTQWVFTVGISKCQDVVKPCSEAVYSTLDCMNGFSHSSSGNFYYSVSSSISGCISVVKTCANSWGINLY